MDSQAQSEEQLLRRIDELEEQYRTTHEARLAAERKLQLRHTQSHHVTSNQKVYGTGNIHYVENPHGKSTLNRLCGGYNLDAFIRKPHLHQYIENGKIYREAEDRQSSKFELFFDLLFVGVVHQISDAAAESPNGLGLVKYILTFCPAFSIWSDVRDVMNQMGTDDVSQRFYILWIMALLVGYSINASSVELSVLGMKLEEGAPANEVEEQDASQKALQYALAFFCVAKLSKVLLNLIYGIFIPEARMAIWTQSANSAIMCLLFFVAIFLPLRSLPALYTLVVLGICLEWLLKLAGGLHFKFGEFRKKRRNSPTTDPTDGKGNINGNGVEDEKDKSPETSTRVFRRLPVYNIEHHNERLGAFVTIVLGEMVANVFYRSTFASGVNSEYGKAVLGLMIAFFLNWLYFDAGGAANYIHAVRRHWFSSFVFTFLHLPLCAALLLASSSVNRFVTEVDIQSGLAWFLGAGIGLSVIIMATIGLLHKLLEENNQSIRTRRRVILTTRMSAGLLMVLLPLAREDVHTALNFMGIYAGILAFLIIEEMITRLEKTGCPIDND